MEIIKILDEIEKIVEKAPHVPLTGRIILDGDLFLDYLDRLRTRLPEDIREAKWITTERERLLEDARNQAQRLLAEAEKKAEEMAAESELVRKAQAQAGEIATKARQVAEEMRSGAYSYAEDVLLRMGDSLEKALAQVRRGLDEMRAGRSLGGEASQEEPRPR